MKSLLFIAFFLKAGACLFAEGEVLFLGATTAIYQSEPVPNFEAVNILDKEQFEGSFPGMGGLTLAGQRLYWTNSAHGKAYSCNPDGSNPAESFLLSSDIDNPQGMVYHEPYFYWSDYQDNQIIRSEIDGSNPTVIIDMTDPTDNELGMGKLLIYQEKIYWTLTEFDPSSGIYRANLDGTNIERVYTSPNIFISGISRFEDRFYWIEGFNDIKTTNDDFSNIEFVVDVGSVFSESYLYSTEATENGVYFTLGNDIGFYDITQNSGVRLEVNSSRDIEEIILVTLPVEPFISISQVDNTSALQIDFSGILQSTVDFDQNWSDLDPQPDSPFEITEPSGKKFFRARAN